MLLFQLNIAYSQDIMWVRPDGGERNEYVYFRKEINLTNTTSKATLNLYADSRYALYINEVYIGFGPARSYHAHPTYDSYDIAPYLTKGKNTIAVKALSNGMVTYQLYDYKGGFTIWGSIDDGGRNIDLDIKTDWLCKKSLSYDQSAARFSFATGSIENVDTRVDVNWNKPNIDTKSWTSPVLLTDQSQWGKLTPRTIPHLTQQEIVAQNLIGIFVLNSNEDNYSFRIPTNDKTLKDYNENHTSLAYTYIYTPKNQEVIAGVWWGDYYLNGKKIKEEKIQPNSTYRKDYKLDLKKGWNLFVSRHGIIWGSWDYNLVLPNNVGLALSSTKNISSENIFESYGPTENLQDNKDIDELDLTKDIDAIKKELSILQPTKKWKLHLRTQTSNHPARDLAWNDIDFNSPIDIPSNISNTLTLKKQKKGTALIYDMGEMQLGRFFIDGHFPEGTILDIGFSEELNDKGTPWLYKRYQIGAGHRFVCTDKINHYETFKPYGARYMQLNVMNQKAEAIINKVGMIRQVYPFEDIGNFNCSDPILNKIWDAGWRTLKLCAEDTYTDTPFRERGLYAGDMLPEAAITGAANGDMRLLAHSLNVFQDMYHDEMYNNKENIHGDFPLITLVTMDYYLQYTGDWDFIKQHYNNYSSLLKNYISKKTKDRLLHSKQVFIEWTDINKHDAAMTANQAMAVNSLNILTKWAKKLCKSDDLKLFKKEAAALSISINNTLWDPNNNKYWDGIKDDQLISKQHLSSSVWPALFDVASKEQKIAILEMLKDEMETVITGHRKNKITPYSSFYLFALLYQHGETTMAEKIMKKHWGKMALHAGTVWENFSIGGEQGTSSHAWSGHPTFFLSSEVLGVNLGFYKELDRNIIEIEPQSATITWAKGTVAHPLGKVDVSWKIVGNRLILNYSAPKDAKVKVAPKGKLANLSLWVNGKYIENK